MTPEPSLADRGTEHDTPPITSLDDFRQSAENLARVRSINPKGFHSIAYQVWGEDTDERPVVCVHGLTRHAGDFEAFSQALCRSRKVICPDLVGRGASDWLPDASDYHVPQYNCDLTAVMAATGCREVDWVGTSLGGLCGIMMAGLPNSPIRRLVINDVAPEVPMDALRRVSKYLSEPLQFENVDAVEMHLREVYAGFGPMCDEDWREMALTSVYCGEEGYYAPHFDPGIGQNFRRYWLLYHFNIWSYWKRITCPILIIRGAESDFLTGDLLKRMLEFQTDATVHEVPGVGHTPVMDHPDLIAITLAWLNGS